MVTECHTPKFGSPGQERNTRNSTSLIILCSHNLEALKSTLKGQFSSCQKFILLQTTSMTTIKLCVKHKTTVITPCSIRNVFSCLFYMLLWAKVLFHVASIFDSCQKQNWVCQSESGHKKRFGMTGCSAFAWNHMAKATKSFCLGFSKITLLLTKLVVLMESEKIPTILLPLHVAAA